MDYFVFSSMLLSCMVSVGICDNTLFSICWMFRDDSFQRSDRNIWLNDLALQSISKEGVFTSVTVSPNFNNSVTLQYAPDHIEKWTFSIHRYTLRHPVKLESRSPSSLFISWAEMEQLSAEDPDSSTHAVTLYRPEGTSYQSLSDHDVSENYYRFTALESCSSYLACVEIADTHLSTCVFSITEPDSPRNFHMKSWNESSITVAWDFPENSTFSLFLLTAFFLNATDHVVAEQALWHRGRSLAFTLSDVPPCSRVRFGLQSVCQAGAEYSYSDMVLMEGTSAHFNMENIQQASYGPDNYTLSWEKTTSKSTFRVYHQGALQGSTPATNFTVRGLQPCQEYLTVVEALCGPDNVLMSTQAVATSTGPHGVLNLTYRSQDSTVWWTPGWPPLEGYLYELSFDNDSSISSGLVTEPQVHLPGLAGGVAYKLVVWAECDGQWQSDGALLCFVAVNVPDGPGDAMEGLMFDSSGPGPFLRMVVPWSLTGSLRDPLSEPRAEMEKIVKKKLEGLLTGFSPPARVQVTDIVPQDNEGRTRIRFASFDATVTDRDVLLPVEHQLDYIQSLERPHVTIAQGILYWDGPDACAAPPGQRCPPNALCINTLGSYTCVCQHGYYNVGPVLVPPVVSAGRPVCNERGLFSQHLDQFLASGIAKPYLTNQLGGQVKVVLNDGRCRVNETDTFFYFRIPRRPSHCGTQRLVNETHTEYRVTMSVTLSKAQTIVRREHKVVWKYVYPRKLKAQSSMKPQWLNVYSLVEFNSSQVLRLSLSLYEDLAYTHRYDRMVQLWSVEILFFQLALDQAVNETFASDVLLEVVSCWTTESPDPDDPDQGIIVLDGCPVDPTFYWLSANGRAQSTRFSMEMFYMTKKTNIYFHCLARICGHDEDCTTNCSPNSSLPLARSRRSLSKRDVASERETVVSVGPLLVHTMATSLVQPSSWTKQEMIAAVLGPVGFLLLALLGLSATKAIMTYYEKLRLE